MTLSPMSRMIVRGAATAGGGAAGYYGFAGSKRERILQAVVGSMLGYGISGMVLNMVPMEAPPAGAP